MTQVAAVSAIGTMATFGIRRWDTNILICLAEYDSLNERFVPRSAKTPPVDGTALPTVTAGNKVAAASGCEWSASSASGKVRLRCLVARFLRFLWKQTEFLPGFHHALNGYS
jgi:hypothetical protein